MEVRKELQEVFRSVLGDQALEIYDKMTASDHKSWDSLTHITLIVASEKHFNIRFKNSELAILMDVGALIALINKKLELC